MASSKALILLCLNLVVFFTLVSSNPYYDPTPSTPPPPPPPPPVALPPVILPSPKEAECLVDAAKTEACVNVLKNGLNGKTEITECCRLVRGLNGDAAAVCLCSNITEKVLEMLPLKVVGSLNSLLNYCDLRNVSPEFQCPE